MLFYNPLVLAFLLEKKMVYTFRTEHPDTDSGLRKQLGKDWATNKRNGSKICDIFVDPVEKLKGGISLEVLNRYAKWTGFSCAREWKDVIEEMHGPGTRRGWIYEVSLYQPKPKEGPT